MKRIALVILLFIGLGLFFTSCKKDYECFCTFDTFDPSTGAIKTMGYDIGVSEKNKDKAVDKCNEIGTQLSGQPNTSNVDCKITD